uniref:Uncharacterized protein n=1 Tax=Setaria viridis TaxID=4556 RepID=A0A4U6U4H3_SETVI|nr:hypothetical protein SEVIR_6G079700v2 [Setaria viridis]
MANISRKQRRSLAAYCIITAWNIWNERNRRIFENKFLSPMQLLLRIQEDINIRKQACGKPGLE